MSPSPPTLGDLEIDILLLIFEYVYESSPASAASLGIGNKHLHAASKLVTHSKKTIVVDSAHAHSQLLRWSEDQYIHRGLRQLTIRDTTPRDVAPASAEPTSLLWDALIALIERLGNLRILTWLTDRSMPAAMIHALDAAQPKCELHIPKWTRDVPTTQHLTADEQALRSSPSLKMIRAVITDEIDDRNEDYRKAVFCNLVASAPNLKIASIIKMAATANESAGSECERQFWHDITPSRALRHLTIDGFPLSAEMLAHWSRFVDISCLDSLKCSRGVPDPSYFAAAPRNLKHVSLNFGLPPHNQELVSEARKYIATCAPLETLSIWVWSRILPLSLIMDQHGQTLKVLQLHERIDLYPNYGWHTLSPDDIHSLTSRCPHLRDLTIDMPLSSLCEDSETRTKLLLALADTQLQRLQLYTQLLFIDKDSSEFSESEEESEEERESWDESEDSEDEGDCKGGDDGSENPIASHAAMERALRRVWSKIFGERRNGDRILDVKLGEWERKFRPGTGPYCVERDARRWYHLEPVERDDEAGSCTVKIHFPA